MVVTKVKTKKKLQSWKGCNYGMHTGLSVSRLTKFLVNNIHIYDSKLIYYKNIFRN